MKVFSDDKASYVTVEVIETEAQYYPSVNLYVAVTDRGFCGEHHIWISQQELEAFIRQLRHCEQTRQGQVALTSSDELNLKFERSDGWGHFRLHYGLKSASYTTRGTVTHSLTGAFDLDDSLFAQTVNQFAGLLTDTFA